MHSATRQKTQFTVGRSPRALVPIPSVARPCALALEAHRISTPSAGDADAHSDHLPLGLRHNLAPISFIHYLLCSAAPMRSLRLHFDPTETLLNSGTDDKTLAQTKVPEPVLASSVTSAASLPAKHSCKWGPVTWHQLE